LTGKVRIDHAGKMQCTSCHDPHDNQFGKFMVMNNAASALCLMCHDKTYWRDSVHNTSPAQWKSVGQNPWPYTPYTSVAANACANCHATHGAETGPRLLVFDTEEQNCERCHNGNVASTNVMQEFSKASIHPIRAYNGRHDPVEDLVDAQRHVECVDCHNPHASKSSPATAPSASGALAGVAGVNSERAVVDPITREYELCYRCHADSENRGTARVPRLTVETNTRLEFALGNKSYHPVEGAGKNLDMPSLIAPWTWGSLMYCTDCHNSDAGPGAGGSGPNGPHGSVHIPLLERNLTTTDYGDESATAYALCYKCHSRDSIMGDRSFTKHHAHVADVKAACTTCHDSHGVAGVSHLINFNTTYVTPSSSGRREFIDGLSARQGSCYLTCHGKNHNPLSYAP
jgi:predicted CXXCH cytochrome family protein